MIEANSQPIHPELASLAAPLLNETEVSKVIHVSVKTLQRWRYEGVGPRFIKVESAVRYSKYEIDAYLAQRGASSTGDFTAVR